jgi:hypothetical protein
MESPGNPKINRPTRYPRAIATTARTTQPAKESPFDRPSARTAAKAASPNTPPMTLSIRHFPDNAENIRRTNDGRSETGASGSLRVSRSAIERRQALAAQPG